MEIKFQVISLLSAQEKLYHESQHLYGYPSCNCNYVNEIKTYNKRKIHAQEEVSYGLITFE